MRKIILSEFVSRDGVMQGLTAYSCRNVRNPNSTPLAFRNYHRPVRRTIESFCVNPTVEFPLSLRAQQECVMAAFRASHIIRSY
jgi:hypothetical protein